MVSNDEQYSPNNTEQHAQLQKAQQKLKEFISKYNELVESEKNLREENKQLREEIELFNRELIEREGELGQLQDYISDLLSLLKQIKQEEQRSPALHARPRIRKRYLQRDMNLLESESGISEQELMVLEQEILPLNIWLVSRNRFIEQIISHYTRKRERLLIIENNKLVRQFIEVGLLPDIIITGAYDFGLDDPFQQSFFEFLEQVFRNSYDVFGLHELFVITLSASIPVQPDITNTYQDYHVQHKYISKLHGLQVTISELRFFLEMRRCQQDIMEPERQEEISSLEEVTHVMTEIQKLRKTGLLVVLSDEAPPDIRWAFQLFYLQGRLVKTEHTLETSALITPDGEIKPLEKRFIFTSFDSKYKINEPRQLFFFPLYDHAVRREMREDPFLL
jgi:hypothetical protein